MNKLTILSLAVSAALLAGCGGGSSSDTGTGDTGTGDTGTGDTGTGDTGTGDTGTGDTGTGDTGTGDTGTGDTGTGDIANAQNPIVSLSCSDSNSILGLNATFESGYQGDIKYNCNFPTVQNPTGLEFNLVNGIPSLNIENVQKTTFADFSCTNGDKGRGTVTYDYVSGRVVESGTFNGQSLSCTSTFRSPLATTVSDSSSIGELLEEWGTDTEVSAAALTGLINTTCPQGDDDVTDIDPFTQVCTGYILENYEVTDDNGKKHLISTKISTN